MSNIKDFVRRVVGLGSATLILAMLVATLLPAPKAAAIPDYAPPIGIGGIPASVYLGGNIVNCNDAGFRKSASQTWISRAGASTVEDYNNFVVGTPSIALDYNATIYKCHSFENTGVQYTEFRIQSGTYQFAPCGVTAQKAVIQNIAGKTIREAAGPSAINNFFRYNRGSQTFSIDTSSITSDTTVCIEVASKQYNKFDNGVLICVAPPGVPDIVLTDESAAQVNRCPNTAPGFNFQIRVQVNAPIPHASDTCTGIDVSSNGSRVDVYGPGGGIGSVYPPSTSLNLTGIVAPGTVLDVYAIAGPGQSGNGMINHTWVIPPNCDFRFDVRVTRPAPILHPDDEAPTTADFGATFDAGRKVNGLKITCKFYIQPLSGARRDIAGGLDAIATNTNGSGNYSCDTLGNNLSLGPTPLTAGDKVCVDSGVDPLSGRVNANGDIVQSDGPGPIVPACSTVSNKPYVSFYGNDVKVGGNMEGITNCSSTPTANIRTFSKASNTGSGVQFAAFALGTIDGFTTASLRGAAAPSPPDDLKAPSFGDYNSASCTHNYFADGAATAIVGPYTLNTTHIPTPNHSFIYVNGDVTIKGNVTMDQGPWTDRKQIPSFYLITNGNIFIDNDVTNLAGVYVAQQGNIYTCTNDSTLYATDQLYGNCGRQLVIDGAFIAKQTVLSRTFGSLRDSAGDSGYGGSSKVCSNGVSGPTSVPSCAGELFRFSPSLYLGKAPSPDPSSTTSEVKKYDFIVNLPPVL